jgi:hypothetical protein
MKTALLLAFSLASMISAVQAQGNARNLVGSYVVTGTDLDGRPYGRQGALEITSGPAGVLEFSWDNGGYLGIGQVTGNTLAVSSHDKGRVVIMIMEIGADGGLQGRWWRRGDAGSKGTEVWRRK